MLATERHSLSLNANMQRSMPLGRYTWYLSHYEGTRVNFESRSMSNGSDYLAWSESKVRI